MTNQFTILRNQFEHSRIESIVAMSVYSEDNAKWLKEAIDSIIHQTYTQFLFVIVMDGEVSNAISSVIESAALKDNRVVVAKNTSNVGLASSMNSVAEFAMQYTPSYFVRMDADDISEPHRLLRQITYLNKHKTISVLGSALTEINESGKKVGARVMPSSHKQIVKILPRRCSLNHPTVVIRYNVFRDGFRYDDKLRNTQDYFFWITLAANGYIFRNLKDRLLNFRRVNNFYKRRGFSKSLNEFKARILAIKELKQFSPFNLLYACGVLSLRLMPGKVVKLAYKLDRHFLERFGKH